MHIDRANKIAVSRETASTAYPISALGLVFTPTSGTLATCSSFGASKARDVSLFCFVREVVTILAIFPQGHPLVVMLAVIPIADTMRIANEEASYLVLYTKVNDLTGGFVAQIVDTPFSTTTLLVLGTLQFLPASRILLATRLLLGNLAQMSIALPLERTNTTSRDD